MEVLGVRWYRSLSFKGTLLLGLVAVGLIIGAVIMMRKQGKRLVLAESSRLMEQIGANIVTDLSARAEEIACLTRTLATAAEQLEKSEEVFNRIVPQLIDYHGDLRIAGGGVWPEPFAFDPKRERRSFFWGREPDGSFRSFDDYNQPGDGYHNEEWYVIVRHLERGRCSWSRAYLDPHSHQLTVTATVATQDAGGQFSGTVTIDLKLETLQALTEYWQKKTGGYLFIADQYNQLITFPDLALARKSVEGDDGQPRPELITIGELAQSQVLFAPIASVMEEMNEHLLARAREMPAFDPDLADAISNDSYQVSRPEAELLSAIITDPLARNTFFNSFETTDDYFNREPSFAYTFFVPHSYWKVVIVKPAAEVLAVATRIVQLIIYYLVIMIVPITAAAYLLLDWSLLQPLKHTATSVHKMSRVIANHEHESLKQYRLTARSKDEIGQLAGAFNSMLSEVEGWYEAMYRENEGLRAQIGEREEAETSLLESNRQLEEALAQRDADLKQRGTQEPGPDEEADDNLETRDEAASDEETETTPSAPVPASPAQERLRGMTSDPLRIWDSVALLAEPGPLDEARADEIIDLVADQIEQMQLRYLLLSLSGTVLSDTAVAAGSISRVARSTSLMGIELILIGVGRELARELTQHDLDRISSFITIREGLCHALSGMNLGIVHQSGA